MYSTTAYLYQQRTQVLLLDTSGQYFTMRYDPVYAKRLTINLGVDNVLLFTFVNQDEKPVNVSGCTFTFRVTDTSGARILITEPMVILSALTGQVKVTIPARDTLELRAQPASYSISVQSGNLTQAVFTNAQAGARAPIDLVDSVYPVFLPSMNLTIPTNKLASQVSMDGASPENWPDWAGNYWSGGGAGPYFNVYQNTEYYSSFIVPTSALTTIQMDLDGYTGTIKVQAAQNYESIWYNVTESTTHYNETKTHHINVVGWYPLLRICFNNSLFSTPAPPGIPATAYAVCNDGVLTSVQVVNGGGGYLAPPKVNIMGDGAGAVCEAVLTPNITAITITNPGLGYTSPPEIVFTGVGSNLSATCTIDGSGSVDSITIVNSGDGYTQAPTITFVGTCTTPAQATATVNSNRVITAINIIDGGSGYWPIPSGGVNPAAYPVPPANQGAFVAITTGYVVDLLYR